MGANCYYEKKRTLNHEDDKNIENINPTISLLKDIKSKYIINNVFSFINERRKLEIIKYSKYIQKKFQIYIIYYEHIYGKYRVGGDNGKIKEFSLDENILIFEGEYLNGRRNGKGKEFTNSGIIFEGEYANGKRNGKGKLYDYNTGNLIFEGEYLNGVLHGKALTYYNTGKLKFEEEYLCGQKNGKRKIYNNDGIVEIEEEYWNGVILSSKNMIKK